MTPQELAAPRAPNIQVEHFSYHLATMDEMRLAVDMLQARAITIDRGYGRHGPGGNTFIVFRDPDGNNVEFYSDMIQVTEENPHSPRVWSGAELETFDQWHLEHFVVPPPERIIKLMPMTQATYSEAAISAQPEK